MMCPGINYITQMTGVVKVESEDWIRKTMNWPEKIFVRVTTCRNHDQGGIKTFYADELTRDGKSYRGYNFPIHQIIRY